MVLRTPDLAWYSLQTGEQRQELAEQSPEVPIHDLSSYLHDWGDAALLLDELDLVLTVDTAMAHLAGALGKPAWVLLREGPAWCWGDEGEQTPWYPTLRLFRQARAGGWAELMARVTQALAVWRETVWRGRPGRPR
jgi:ADP-heptose:LPS heptosyltransferase